MVTALCRQSYHNYLDMFNVAYDCCTDAEQKSHEALQQPGLTRMSREIRAETLPVFYGRNVFVVKQTSILDSMTPFVS